jgi:hypothetical protein
MPLVLLLCHQDHNSVCALLVRGVRPARRPGPPSSPGSSRSAMQCWPCVHTWKPTSFICVLTYLPQRAPPALFCWQYVWELRETETTTCTACITSPSDPVDVTLPMTGPVVVCRWGFHASLCWNYTEVWTTNMHRMFPENGHAKPVFFVHIPMHLQFDSS